MDVKKKLRCAVLLERKRVSAWQARCVSLVLADNTCELLATVVTAGTRRTHPIAWCIDTLKHLLWKAFSGIVRDLRTQKLSKTRVWSHRVLTVRRVTDVEQRLELSPESLLEIGRLDLDYIIYFGALVPASGLRGAARHGVWSFRYPGAGPRDGAPPAFWELLRNESVTRAVLQRFTIEDPAEGFTLRHGFFSLVPDSYGRTIELLNRGSIDFPLLAVRDLLAGKSPAPVDEQIRAEFSVTEMPSNAAMLLLFALTFWRKVLSLLSTAFTRIQWNVGIVAQPVLNPRNRTEVKDVRWLPIDKLEGFAADPFFVRTDGLITLLAEDMDKTTARGKIVAWQVGKSGCKLLGTAIQEEETHLSYPYLVAHQGDIYCVPEQASARTIALYKALEFPLKWQRVGDLIPFVEGVDPTIFRHDEYWWLAYTDGADRQGRLMMWYARNIQGPWMPHTRNPVKIDPRSSRGAGRPFIFDGMLIRPSQDCSSVYGAKIVFNWVRVLTPLEFREEVIGELAPDPAGPYPVGLHTICYDGEVALVDGKRSIFDPTAWAKKVRAKVRRARRPNSRRWPSVSEPNARSKSQRERASV